MPKVIRIPLIEGPSREPSLRLSPPGSRFAFHSDRDERAYHARWFEDFRDRWRGALKDARVGGRLFAFDPTSDPTPDTFYRDEGGEA